MTLHRWCRPVLHADPASFRHDSSSCRGRFPKTFAYHYVDPDSSSRLPLVLLGDEQILNWRRYSAAKYFGWLTESSAIITKTIEAILGKIGEIESAFEKIYTSDRRLLAQSSCFEEAPNGSTLPWVAPLPRGFTKSRLVSIVASRKQMTEGHRLRDEAIGRFAPLDVFGQGRRPIQKKENALWPYYFSVAVENARYPNYFTEKVTDCFASKTVPIYWGNPQIGNTFNPKGILGFHEIRREDLTAELYHRLLPAVEDNFQKTLNLKLPDDIIYQKIKSFLGRQKQQSNHKTH